MTGIEAALPSMHTLLTLGRRVVLIVTALLAVHLVWRYGWPQQSPARRKDVVFQRALVVMLTAVVAVEAVSVGLTGESAVANYAVAMDAVAALQEVIR